MKNLIVLILFLSSCTPVRYVNTNNSATKKQRITHNYQHLNVPLYYGYDFYFRPFYNPIIIQRSRPLILPYRNHHTRPNRFRR